MGLGGGDKGTMCKGVPGSGWWGGGGWGSKGGQQHCLRPLPVVPDGGRERLYLARWGWEVGVLTGELLFFLAFPARAQFVASI